MKTVTLKRNREESLLRRHPWVFSGAVAASDSGIEPGETVAVCAHDGAWLAAGAWSPLSQIRIRVWSFDQAEEIDAGFFRRRLARAIAARDRLLSEGTTSACRLVNAESDGLPGVIVDRYGGVVVCQFFAAGAERWRGTIVDELDGIVNAGCIYERSDADVRTKEGLEPRTGVLRGSDPPELLEIDEYGLRFLVDIRRGHKTGFYLDQRENRTKVAGYANGAEVLNCFSYTGGFCLHALRAGASKVVNIDSSPDVLDLASKNVELNGLDGGRVENVTGDVFKVLRTFRDSRRSFDMVILDPPKFVSSAAQMPRGARGYKDINLLAFKLLRPGGVLATFSCSGLMEPSLFGKIVADAALDAGRDAQIVEVPGQAADHPVALSFPEGRYLTGLICTVW